MDGRLHFSIHCFEDLSILLTVLRAILGQVRQRPLIIQPPVRFADEEVTMSEDEQIAQIAGRLAHAKDSRA